MTVPENKAKKTGSHLLAELQIYYHLALLLQTWYP